MPDATHNVLPDNGAAERLLTFIERVERVDREIERKQSEQMLLLRAYARENPALSGFLSPSGRRMGNPLLRFADNIVPQRSGCWEWARSKTNGGYGLFGVGGKYVLAHRWVYEVCRGDIPTGLVIDHLCRKRDCVNPFHLEPVTPSENVLRGLSPMLTAARMKAKTVYPRGHPYSGGNLYIIPATGGRTCRACAHARRAAYEAKKRGER